MIPKPSDYPSQQVPILYEILRRTLLLALAAGFLMLWGIMRPSFALTTGHSKETHSSLSGYNDANPFLCSSDLCLYDDFSTKPPSAGENLCQTVPGSCVQRDCDDDPVCEDVCDEIFDRNARKICIRLSRIIKIFDELFCRDRNARKICMRLTIYQVEKLMEVYAILESAEIDDLEEIDIKYLKLLIEISPDPIIDLFYDFSDSEVASVTNWFRKNMPADLEDLNILP